MFHKETHFKILVFLTVLTIGAPLFYAHAISIQDKRGEKLLLKLEGTSVEKGDRFLVVDSEGKRRALIEISQIKNDDAVAHLIKGAMTQSLGTYSVQSLKDLKAQKTSPSPTDGPALPSSPTLPSAPPSPPPKPAAKWKIRGRTGTLVGFGQNAMKVSLTGVSSLNMKGSSLSAEGFYEGSFTPSFQILGRFGAQTLKASGTLAAPICGGSTECSLDVTYLSAEGLGKYMLGSKKYATWLGGGVGLLFALAKSSNVVDVEKIGFTQKLIFATGAQIPLSSGAFIPLQLDYAIFPNSAAVSVSQIFLRAGYGFKF